MRNRPGRDAPNVVLDLSEACIETAARRARQRLTDELLRDAPATTGAEETLALLDAFLAGTDFRRLRAGDEDLAGGRPCRVRLARGDGGAIVWVKERPEQGGTSWKQ
jgi:hypothetical protein